MRNVLRDPVNLLLACITIIAILLIFSCSDDSSDGGGGEVSSSSSSSVVAAPSSSSLVPVSSSSSSSEVVASSSSFSSSSEDLSSSSEELSSSSEDLSSSSDVLSSSSAVSSSSSSSSSLSSSSSRVSSSSGGASSSSSGLSSSSSSVDWCAGFADGTRRLHYGRQKRQFCDKRDGTKYVYVEIGEQTWMAENVKYKTNEYSWCYDNMSSNCREYGRLYSPAGAALACPENWHLPTQAEWNELITFVGGPTVAAKNLRAKEGWANCGPTSDDPEEPTYQYPCEDTDGFAAIPTGYGSVSGGTVSSFSNLNVANGNDIAYLYGAITSYTGTPPSPYQAYYVNISRNNANITSATSGTNPYGVRCVKDELFEQGNSSLLKNKEVQ